MSSYSVHRSLPPTRRSSSDATIIPIEARSKPLPGRARLPSEGLRGAFEGSSMGAWERTIQANRERLTVAQAAARLGISEGAVRSRIKRGTLRTDKEGGTVFVLLGDGTSQANQTTNTGVP